MSAMNEETVEQIHQTMTFLYGEVTEADDTTIRAMLVAGGTKDQVIQSITIAAVNTRVEREDKSRYAFGCLRNIMMEKPDPDTIDIVQGDGTRIARFTE